MRGFNLLIANKDLTPEAFRELMGSLGAIDYGDDPFPFGSYAFHPEGPKLGTGFINVYFDTDIEGTAFPQEDYWPEIVEKLGSPPNVYIEFALSSSNRKIVDTLAIKVARAIMTRFGGLFIGHGIFTLEEFDTHDPRKVIG